MKKYLFTMLLALSVGVLAFAATRNYPTEPAVFTIASDSLMIMAPRLETARDWVYGRVYHHGDMVRSTNYSKVVYWQVNGTTQGISAVTCPSHLQGDATETGGTNIWRRIPPQERLGCSIQNTGTSSVWLAIGHAAEVGKGIELVAGATFWKDNDTLQDSVFGVCDTGDTNTVVTQEN